jgi:Mn2+/Fe2+ NRAMP family transporter
MKIIVLFRINGTRIGLDLNIPLKAIVHIVIIVVILVLVVQHQHNENNVRLLYPVVFATGAEPPLRLFLAPPLPETSF